MKKTGWIAASVLALAFAGVAVDAQAQSRPRSRVEAVQPNPAVTAQDASPSARRRTLELNTDGRWSLKLDYQQPTTRGEELRDVEAGAYYRLTPRVRVGGSVGLGDQSTPRRVTDDERPQPRVRLETIFRF